MWDLPGPGLEPTSPALAGGFLTTAPSGKSDSHIYFLLYIKVRQGYYPLVWHLHLYMQFYKNLFNILVYKIINIVVLFFSGLLSIFSAMKGDTFRLTSSLQLIGIQRCLILKTAISMLT